jgi:multicomponent Na+:H+ antiporter subunit C
MTAAFLYGAAGLLLFALGLWSLLVHEPLLRKLIAFNIMGSGVFHLFIAVAHRSDGSTPDPVPHALVLTGIVVAVSATALALALNSRLEEADAKASSTKTTPTGASEPSTTARTGLPDPSTNGANRLRWPSQ